METESEGQTEGTNEAGQQAPEETKPPRRKRRASNYCLERIGVNQADEKKVWMEVKDGFVSPKSAFFYATRNNIEGVLRVVRVASPAYEYKMTTPKPVLVVEKVG